MSAQGAPRRDFAGHYRIGHRVELDTRREADSLRFYLRFPDGSRLRAGQALQISTWASYDAHRPLRLDTVRLAARRIRRVGTTAWVEVCWPAARLVAGQVLRLSPDAEKNDAAGDDAAWVELTPDLLTRAFVLTDSVGMPLFHRYVHVNELFSVDNFGPDQPLLVKRYAASFGAALPPMTDPRSQPPVAPTLAVQDTLHFKTSEVLRLQTVGVYNLRVGNNSIGLLVEDHTFPELTSAAELIQPLIYLTTSAERKKLYDAPDPKRAVDRFWLSLSGSQQTIARQLIRTYYGRVADANRLFSAHKDGWMTDRGMLYVVLGPPDAVYRSAGEERWTYHNDQAGTSTYTFRAKPSTFAPEHYELVRRPEHELLWYAAVEQWRKGLTAPTGR